MSAQDHSFDVTVIVNGHREQRLAWSTFRALKRCVVEAKQHDISVEVVGVLDAADDVTRRMFRESLASIPCAATQLLDVEVRDTGLARNLGVEAARGGVIAFVDGDDLPSANWIAGSLAVIRGYPEPCIVHPSAVVRFGAGGLRWTPQWSSTDQRSRIENLVDYNLWHSMSMANAEIFRQFPYPPCHSTTWGPEDWAFHIDTAQAGIDHVVAPGVTVFYRIKESGSLNAAMTANGCLRWPHPYFVDVDRARRVQPEARSGGEEILPPEAPPELSPDLVAEWCALHALEPRLPFPTRRRLDEVKTLQPWVTHGLSLQSAVWWQLVAAIGTQRPDVLIVVPQLGRGDVDRRVADYVAALTRLRPEARIAVVTTDDPSEASVVPPEGTALLDVASFPGYQGLWRVKRTRVLATLVSQFQPHTVHVIDSVVGFDAIEMFPYAMTAHSAVFLSTSGVETLPTGESRCPLFCRPSAYLDQVAAVLVDDEACAQQLRDVTGFDLDKFVAHTPAGDAVSARERFDQQLQTLPRYLPDGPGRA